MKRIILILSYCLFVFFILLSGFRCTLSKNNESNVQMNKPSIKEVIQKHSGEIMSIPGVEGIYQGETGEGKPCIKVMVETKADSIKNGIPESLEGYPVIIEVSGKIKPM